MKLLDSIKNNFLYGNKYKTHSEAIIISCYFNPQNNPYRVKAFNTFYDSIKHLNHHIVECVIGDAHPQLPENDNISRVHTANLLWHKESLLNLVVSKLDRKYKYIFWVDADVIFTNDNWLVDGVKSLQTNNLVQPFEYCIHLEQDETKPSFSVEYERPMASDPKRRHPRLWRSFGYNHSIGNSGHQNYDVHGHVGFAWGARREVLDLVPLYDRALVGGADHIIAHAGAGQICHSCITKAFGECPEDIMNWSNDFYNVVRGKIGYVKGDLYHIWHGAVEKRQYLKRVQEFTPIAENITKRDKNGLHVTEDDSYVKNYFDHREVKSDYKKVDTSFTKLYPEVQKKHNITPNKEQYDIKRAELQAKYPDKDDSFIDSLIWGYITDSTAMGTVMGGNVMGAMVGDMLNDNDNHTHHDHSHHNNDTITSDNFS